MKQYNYKCIVSKNGSKMYYKRVNSKWKRISNTLGQKAEKGKRKYNPMIVPESQIKSGQFRIKSFINPSPAYKRDIISPNIPDEKEFIEVIDKFILDIKGGYTGSLNSYMQANYPEVYLKHPSLDFQFKYFPKEEWRGYPRECINTMSNRCPNGMFLTPHVSVDENEGLDIDHPDHNKYKSKPIMSKKGTGYLTLVLNRFEEYCRKHNICVGIYDIMNPYLALTLSQRRGWIGVGQVSGGSMYKDKCSNCMVNKKDWDYLEDFSQKNPKVRQQYFSILSEMSEDERDEVRKAHSLIFKLFRKACSNIFIYVPK